MDAGQFDVTAIDPETTSEVVPRRSSGLELTSSRLHRSSNSRAEVEP